MKKVKTWFSEHKKEIIIGALAAGGTAFYFVAKEKGFRVQAVIRLTLRFLDGPNEDEFGWKDNREIYTSFNMNNPDLSISDLGKFGDLLREKIPQISDATRIDNISANYTFKTK